MSQQQQQRVTAAADDDAKRFVGLWQVESKPDCRTEFCLTSVANQLEVVDRGSDRKRGEANGSALVRGDTITLSLASSGASATRQLHGQLAGPDRIEWRLSQQRAWVRCKGLRRDGLKQDGWHSANAPWRRGSWRAKASSLHDVAETGTLVQVQARVTPSLGNSLNSSGWTPLRCAVFARPDNAPNRDIVRYLASVTQADVKSHKGGLLPVHEAARLGKLGFVQVLSELHAETLLASTSAGLTALHYAVQAPPQHARAVCGFLLSKGADPNQLTNDKNNVLHYLGAVCADRGGAVLSPDDEQLWELLVGRGVDEQAHNAAGHSAVGKLCSPDMNVWLTRCRASKVDWRNPPETAALLAIAFDVSPPEAKDLLNQMHEQRPTNWPHPLVAFREFCLAHMHVEPGLVQEERETDLTMDVSDDDT